MTDTKLEPTIETKKVKVDGETYNVRALTIGQIRPIINREYDDDISIASYLCSEGTDEIENFDHVINQPANKISHYMAVAQEVMKFSGLDNQGNIEKK